MSRSVKGTNKNIVANFDKIWSNMFQTGRDTSFGSKKVVFQLKNWNWKKCINRRVKGTNKNIILNFDEIWSNMFRMGRDIILGLKTLFFTLKMRYNIFARKLGSGYPKEHFCEIWLKSALPALNAGL